MLQVFPKKSLLIVFKWINDFIIYKEQHYSEDSWTFSPWYLNNLAKTEAVNSSYVLDTHLTVSSAYPHWHSILYI